VRHLTQGIAAPLVCVLALLSGACNKGPADEAMQAAERALAAAPAIATYLPEESAAIAKELRDARVSFAEGRYTDALRAVQPLPDRIAAAADAAAKRKRQLTEAWSALSAELPARFEALAARLATLSSAGWISSERASAAQAELAALNQAWADATAAHGRGEITKALAAGEDVRVKAEALGTKLGLRAARTGAASVQAK
jgi:hypothetical protein